MDLKQTSSPQRWPLLLLHQPWLWITCVWVAVYMCPFGWALLTDDWVFHDPDTYMRFYRVLDLFQGGPWFNPLIARIGTDKIGFAMHWTRLLDGVVYGSTLCLKVWLPLKQALVYCSAFLNAFWPWIGALAISCGGRRALSSHGALMAGLLVLTEGWMLGYGSAFHPDHHSLLACCIASALGLMMTIHTHPSRRWAWGLGVICALGIGVSFEWMILFGVLWAGWMIKSLQSPQDVSLLKTVLISTLIGLTVLLILERGSDWAQPDHDRLSWVHGACVGLLSVITFLTHAPIFRIIHTYQTRWALWVSVSGICVGLVLFIQPQLLSGFLHIIDPRIEPIWHHHVSEILPLFQGKERWAVLVYALGHPLAALGLMLWIARTARSSPFPLFIIVSIVGLCVYIPLALYQIRHALFAQIFGILPLVYGLERLGCVTGLSRIRRAGLIASVLIFPTIGAFFLSPSHKALTITDKYPKECRTWNLMITSLKDLTSEGAPSWENSSTLFLTTLGVESTRILFDTPWRILGVPYHRNIEGVVASHHIFSAPSMNEGIDRLHDYGINYILFARDHLRHWMESAQAPSSAFYHDLINGTPSSQLRYVTLPEPLGKRFVLIQVNKTTDPFQAHPSLE